jgi:ornithine cyclodeaminase
MIRLVEDDLERLGRRAAIDAMRSFLRSSARGRTVSPPRFGVPVGERTLVFTVGGDLDRGVAGFRLYSTGGAETPPGRPSQLLSLLDLPTGEVLATAEGAAFGAWRTAALGGVALEESLRGGRESVTAAVLGAGFQAHHQARTWAATGRVSVFRVWARRPEAAEAFARDLARDAGRAAEAAPTADVAVLGAGAVLCATSSPMPVFGADVLADDAYVATLGPKFGGRHEVPAEAYARAAALLSDAPAQVTEYERTRGALPGGRIASEAVSLAEVVAGVRPLPTTGLRLFVSEGLAGSEVALLEVLWRLRGGARS